MTIIRSLLDEALADQAHEHSVRGSLAQTAAIGEIG